MVRHARSIILAAQDRLGMEERPRGSNDGPELRSFLAGTQWKPGQPWCIYFALECVNRGFHPFEELPDYLKPTGSASVLAYRASKAGQLASWASTGSIALFKGGPSGYYHGGIVAKVDISRRLIWTIEGNTNDDGSPDGWKVCEHRRNLDSARYVIW